MSDGLGNFVNTKDYKGKLKKLNEDNSKDNQQFDIVLSNPPYSVSSFKQTTRDYYTEKDFELYDKITDNSSEIECLFVERTKQLLKDGGVAGIILPSSILTNTGIYTKTRELLLKYFEIVAITELGSNTFMATGTNTVVLFLRRRNNYECINIQKAVDTFITNHVDVTINNIETPIAKYVNYVWEGLDCEDYITLLEQNPNDKVKKHDLFKEYTQKIITKTEKEFWYKVIELEKEKIYYFILAYPQKLVVVKTGEKDAEKQFLGYEFSNRRGSEGIHAIQRGKSIDECTKLFDNETFDNPQKASTYIYKAFEKDFNFEIDETLKDNISRVNLLDMMTFDRVDFEKVINVKTKKKIKIESKWDIVKIGDIATTQYGYTDKATEKGTIRYLRITDIKDDGSIQSKEFGAKYITPTGEIEKQYILNNDDIVIARSGTVGKSAIYSSNKCEQMIFASYLVRLLTDKTRIVPKYLFYYTQSNLYWQQVNAKTIIVAQPNLNAEKIKSIQIPLPPLDIQQKIVDEIEEVEDNYNKYVVNINKYKISIQSILDNIQETLFTLQSVSMKITDGSHNPPPKSAPSEYCMLSATNITEGGLDISAGCRYLKEEDFLKENKRTQINKDDILLSIVGSIGKSAIITSSDFKITVQRSVAVIKPNKNVIIPKYLFYYIKSNHFQTILQDESHGTSQKGIYLEQLKNIKIPLPSIQDQQKIVSQIEELEKQIAEAQAVIDNSKQQKQAILDKYLK